MTTLIPKFEQSSSTTNRPINLKLSDTVSVLDFGADPTGSSDSTTAIQNAINYCQTNKRTLLLNGGTYQTTATLVINNPYGGGLTIVGEGDGTSVIKANHNGTAVISMIGATNCTLFNFGIVGGLTSTPSIFPKCGIITGRSSANSAGWHTFIKLQISGSYSQAGIYNIASEGNSWYDLFVICAAPYGVYISGIDALSVGGLTASSMLGANFYNASIYTVDSAVSIASVFVQGAISSGQICFFGGYFVSAGGSYVTLNTSGQDNSDSLGPYIFDGIVTEPNGVGINPIGFNLTGGIPSFLRQLTITNCVFRTGTANFITKSTAVGFANANIQGVGIVVANSFTTLAPSTFGSNNFYFVKTIPPADGNNYNSVVDVGFGVISPTAQGVTLASPWTNTYSIGNGYGSVGFYVDALGIVYLTGAPGSGTANSTIFTLPVGARPKTNLLFSVTSNTGGEQISISTAGVVALIGTGEDPVFLNGIVFPRA